MAKNVFSVDINENVTRVGYLKKKNKEVEILSLGYADTIQNFFSSSDEKTIQEQAKLISDLHKKLKINETATSIILPDAFTYSSITVMPKLKEEQLAESIRLQADDFIPLPIEDVYIDLEILHELDDNRVLILIVASQKRIVDILHKTVVSANLQPEALENEMNAVGRFITETYSPLDEPYLLFNFGYSSSSIYLHLPELPHFQLSRTTKIGFNLFVRDLQLNLNLSETKAEEALMNIGLTSNSSIDLRSILTPVVDELASELQKTIQQAKNNYNLDIKHVYMFNYNHKIPTFKEYIQQKIFTPTSIFPIEKVLKKNKVIDVFQDDISSFLGVIAGGLR